VWLENHLSLSIITVWGAEARGLHAPIVPPPTAPPPPRLSLPVGIRRGHLPGLPKFLGAFIMLSLGDAEAGQRLRAWTLKKLLPSLQYFLADPSPGVPPC